MTTAQEHRILTVAAIREIEKTYEARQPSLMSQAGLAIAARVKKLCPDKNAPILIVAGPGHNGGDAIIAAAHLADWGYCPTILMDRTIESLSSEAQSAFHRWHRLGNALVKDYPSAPAILILDGLFGIGLDRPIEGIYGHWIRQINKARLQENTIVLSIDIPSGLNADRGHLEGICVKATETMTFIALKPGLLTLQGPDHCGDIQLETLHVDIAPKTDHEIGEVNDPTRLHGLLPPRLRNTHKGTYGTVGLIGGTDSLVGAIILAARAAIKFGTGRVIIGLMAKKSIAFDPLYPEIMIRSSQRLVELVSDSAIKDYNVLILGPGMGDLVYAATPIIRNALLHSIPLVLDADALNIIAIDKYLQKMVRERQAPTIMTPHPGEAARLLDTTIEEVQRNRLETAKTLAKQFNALVALKGTGTVLARPDGHWRINRTGNPGMAAGGMGDVLSGLIGALIAQKMAPFDALATAVCLHGAAADACVDAGVGPVGLTASEIIDQARSLLNRLV